MQRYRVNYRLLIGLFVGSIVAAVTLNSLWSWQLSRKATWYRARSQAALEKDDKLEAFDYLQKFVKLRRADTQARVELAAIAADILELEGVSREDQMKAFAILDQTVRRTGDPTARRILADLFFQSKNPRNAVTHYEELLKDDPHNPELKSLLVRSLFRTRDFKKATPMALQLIGYDSQSDTFDVEKAEAADQPEIYATLANVLVSREREPELAQRVIDQMITVNPDSAVAHLERSAFLYSRDDKEEAAAELDRAHELDPESSDILYRRGVVATGEEQYETVRDIAAQGIEKYPDEMRYYRLLANAELNLKEYEKAIATLDKAIEQFSEERSLDFMILKANVLFAQNDVDGVKEVIHRMEKLENPGLKPLIEFEYARLTYRDKKWAEAAQQLKRVRPQLLGFGRMQAVAGLMLGECYERLGKLDLALQVYDLVQVDDAISAGAPVKRTAEARSLAIKQRLGLDRDVPTTDLDSLVREMLAKPEAEQDWAEIDAYLQELFESRPIPEVQRKLLRAQVFLQRKMLPEAKELIREAAQVDPNDVSVRFAAVQLLLVDPSDGPRKAWQLLEKIEQQHGASVKSRALKAEALAKMNNEDVKAQLQMLMEGTSEWNDLAKVRLLASIGLKFLQLNDADEASRYFNQAVDLAPDNLPLRVQLFDIAFQRRDDDAMREAQQKILDLVQTKKDGNYILTEVKRKLVAASREQDNREEFLAARKLLDDALARRPQWHELHLLYGQLLLTMGEDTALALQHFDDALKYGPPNSRAVALQVRLLSQRGELKQARERMNYIPEKVRGQVLGRVEAEVLASNGEKEAAFESAQRELERHADDAGTQAWFGSMASELGKLDEAAAAYRKACDLNPENNEYWSKLVAIYVMQGDSDAVEATFRDAQLALAPEFLPQIQARLFEIRGRWRSAEDIYLSCYHYKDKLDYPASMRRMGEFYGFWATVDPKQVKKAFPYINGLLRAANEGRVKLDDPMVDWARERAVRYLARTGSYQDFLKAQRLLKQSTHDGTVPRRFQALYSQILSSRNDPVSILKAIETMSDLNQRGMLGKKEALLLARLYARTNQWKLGKALMVDTLSQYGGNDPKVWSAYIELLIGQKEYAQAEQRLKRFAEIADNKLQLFQLQARLAHMRGDQAQVKKLLGSMLPPGLGPTTPLDENQLVTIRGIAAMAVNFEEYELAEKLLRIYVSRKPEGVVDLMNVLALHGNVDEALPIMKQLSPQSSLQVAQLAVQMLRQRRLELGDKYDDQVAELVAAAVREDPEAADRLVAQAEMYEVMEKYDESIKAYENVLNRDDLSQLTNAAVMNNLAFLLAQRNQRLDEAEQWINDAIEILGPLADVLDTRAVVHMARQEYDLAVEDMTLALAVDPTAVKFYHLAKAQALAGNADAALEAWQDALDMGIEKESLPLIEQPGFIETEQLVKNLASVETS